MNNEMIESIFGCLERIEEKLDKQPVQNEQGKSEDNENLAEALMPLVDSMNRTSRNLGVLRDALKIISDRQKKDNVELLATVKQEIQTSANKDDRGLANEIHKMKHDILEQLSKPQQRKFTHDLTTNTWWLVGISVVLFFLVFFLTVQIYDQSKEIDRLELSDWKYRALRATLPSNNANVTWLERNVWRGNDEGIRLCKQFVINYEDSVCRRYQMEQKAAGYDRTAKKLMRDSAEIRKHLR